MGIEHFVVIYPIEKNMHQKKWVPFISLISKENSADFPISIQSPSMSQLFPPNYYGNHL